MKSPSAAEHFELKDGIDFENGYFDGVAIKKMVLFPQLIYVDTSVSTDASKKVLIGLLNWAKETHDGIAFEETMIHRWAFVNDVVFKTDFPLLEYQNPVLSAIGKTVETEVAKNLKEELAFTPAEIKISHDPNKRSGGIASFTLGYRANIPFEDNTFYSEAPVPTTVHVQLLEQIETEFRKLRKLHER